MKNIDQIIDEIILKNPYGNKLWEERKKHKFKKEDIEVSIERDKEILQDHPKQTYFNFEDI